MKKGISLIVLVITIIVMIILAAAIIVSISNSNVISKANQAVSDSDLANIKDAATIDYSGVKLGLRDGSVTLAEGESIGERIEANLKAQGVIKEGQNVFINNYGGVEETVVGEPTTWTATGEGNTITKYNGTNTTVIIPNVVNGEKITNISGTTEVSGGATWVHPMLDSSSTETVTLSYGIKEIGSYAFYNRGVKKVIIPESVTKIGESAFGLCSSLNEVVIPGSVKIIGRRAFSNCSSLKSIAIPNGVKVIDDTTFGWCNKLVSIDIPNTVTEIKHQAFGNCVSLESITIPNSVTTLGNQVFLYCYKLNNVIIPDSVTSMSGIFSGCTALSNVTLSKNITSIADATFYNCTSLKNITIPNGVTTIGSGAFSGCSNITIRYSGSATGFPWGATNATLVSN